MCGIAGILSKSQSPSIVPNLLSILTNLIDRGKDGTGIGYIDKNGKIKIQKKDISAYKFTQNYKDKVECNVAIGHVRLPTVGPISESNSHPIMDCNNKIAVVHNGTIKNWQHLRKQLEEEKHIFRGSVDSEVIPHLIEKYYEDSKDLEKAILRTVDQLEGYYTFGVLSDYEPENIFLYRHHFPIMVYKDENESYFSSERKPLATLLKKRLRVKNLKKNELHVLSS